MHNRPNAQAANGALLFLCKRGEGQQGNPDVDLLRNTSQAFIQLMLLDGRHNILIYFKFLLFRSAAACLPVRILAADPSVYNMHTGYDSHNNLYEN